MVPPSLDVPKPGKMSSGHGTLHGSTRRPFSKRRIQSKTPRNANTAAITCATPAANHNGRNRKTVCGGGSWCARSFECSCRFLRYWMLLAALGGALVIQQMISSFRVRGMLGSSLALNRGRVGSERMQPPRIANPGENALVPLSGAAGGANFAESLEIAVDDFEIHEHEQTVEHGTPEGLVEDNERNEQAISGREAEAVGFHDEMDGGGGAGRIGASSVLLGIPTVPRPKGVDYLEETLQAILSQSQAQSQHSDEDREKKTRSGDDGGCEVRVLVMNVHGDGHEPFDEAQRKYRALECMTFLTVGEAVDLEGNKIKVGEGERLSLQAPRRKALPVLKVQKQTRDLVYLLRAAAGRAENYMFMEDDMRLCEGGIEAMRRMLGKANTYHSDWIAIRSSFGMNGILIPDKDVLPFATYLERYQKRRPPDHLVVEWFGGETSEALSYKGDRKHLAFRHNIFEHLGRVSTLRGKPSPSYPSCFEELTTKTLFEVEVFDYKGCPEDDISPCDVPDSAKAGFPNVEWRVKYGKKLSSR